MILAKNFCLFAIGGCAYVVIELLFRGYSHYTMFLLAGVCFLAIGHLGKRFPRLNPALHALLSAAICTAGELAVGLVFNRSFTIWDYRGQPGNFAGQICPLFTLLWIPLSFCAGQVFHRCDRLLERALHRMPKGRPSGQSS